MASEVAVVKILSNDAGTLNALGSVAGVNAKIFMGRIPQGTQSPAIVIVREATVPSDTKTNVSRLDEETIKISCYADDYASALAIAMAVRAAIDGIMNQTYIVGGITVNIDHIWMQNEIYLAEENPDNILDVFEQTYSIRTKY